MTINPSSDDASPDFIPLSSKEGRARDAETIRLQFVRSKGSRAVPPVDLPSSPESSQDER
jgi:hypothetical protein